MKNLYPHAAPCCAKILLILFTLFSSNVNAQESMRANLYIVDGSAVTLMDGNLTNYNDIYSNSVDSYDAWKMINPGVNFGIYREVYNLVVERRKFVQLNDTTFFRSWNLPLNNYRIRFVLKNLNKPGLTAVLKDTYLNTESLIGLNDTTYYNFAITANAASANEMRFQLIYRPVTAPTLDVNFMGIQAQRKGKDVWVEWAVANELQMDKYVVENSFNGRDFNPLHAVEPINSPLNNVYSYRDASVANGLFYRIKGISLNGKIQYSPVAKVRTPVSSGEIEVFPNPVMNKTVKLQFSNQPAGKYQLELLHTNGIIQPLKTLDVKDGQRLHSVMLPQNITPGVYRIRFTGPENTRTIKSIQVL